ncbi:putative phosphatase regulatory subunit-domain-containing protein [Vararia minispora EC-137]|uniref:Phosphatase regulatory subunit-domain-containing protein n=1 Tax=Vararia minispora EC-137 TaxID=1314806 RepID=A0ACB8QKF9_9AGAM|nr:putative phosphatase regulatory subunit-domain-containing protein [Vararia minispora EC-137]
MPYVLHSRSSSEGSVPSSSRPAITFSDEKGAGAFAPLGALPRRPAARQRKFHLLDDDNTPSTPPQISPPDTPPEPAEGEPAGIPFPSSSAPLSPPLSAGRADRIPSAPRIVRSGSSPIILSNGKPLKPSLKSSSSSSIPDEYSAQNRALHTRAQSMPSTPAFGPKNVHFQEDDQIATVRVFRATGRPRSVSTNEDTETETEPEQPAYPFPAIAGAHRSPSSLAPLMEIDPSPARTSPVPRSNASPYANIHLEAISLPPSRPPVLRGSVLVRNVSFEKRVGLRFTLDEWTTVSEVIATYSTSLSSPHPLLPTANLTLGDLAVSGSASGTSQWDRFSFAIRLEDYEARLMDRTLLLAASYHASGVGEWWDNNAGANYRVAFRARAPSPPPSRKPSAALFTTGAASALPPPPAAPRSFPPVPPVARPAPIVRSTSSPTPPTMRTLGRLSLKQYAAPAPPALSVPAPPPPTQEDSALSPLKIVGGQFATQVDEAVVESKPAEQHSTPPQSPEEPPHVDEGFETGSEDEDEKPKPADPPAPALTRSPSGLRLDLDLDLGAPEPRRAAPTVALSARGPFSPTRSSPVPFTSMLSAVAQTNTNTAAAASAKAAAGESRGDATYAALIREWCFAQGDANGSAAAAAATAGGWELPGKQNMLWVGMGG